MWRIDTTTLNKNRRAIEYARDKADWLASPKLSAFTGKVEPPTLAELVHAEELRRWADETEKLLNEQPV